MFKADISKWDVSSVNKMGSMFVSTQVFNADMSKWDASSLAGMFGMFDRASSFNTDIYKWDVSVTDMQWMLGSMSSFHAGISGCNVSSATDMQRMFSTASSFNVDISKWNELSITSMRYMFERASSFTWTLCGSACAYSEAEKKKMFEEFSGQIAKTAYDTGE